MNELRSPLHDDLNAPFTPDEASELGAKISARRAAMRDSGGDAENERGAAPWLLAAAAAVALGVFGYAQLSDQSGAVSDPVAKGPATPSITQPQDNAVPTPAPEPGPLRLEDGALPAELASHAEAAEYRFDDGSTMQLFEKARLSTASNNGEEIAFALDQGSVDVHVQPNGPRRWVFQTHLAEIEVIGTRFSIEREPESVTVRVARGMVAVRSELLENGEIRLTAGEEVIVRAKDDEPAPKKAWQRKAKAQKFKEAYQDLGASGIKRETKRARTVNELFSLADVARLSGHSEDAVEPLEHLVRRFPHDRRAGVAAFTLGRINMTKLNRPARAAAYFERAIQLGVPPSLRESAYVRAIETHVRAGDKPKARKVIRSYLSKFPQGHYVDEVREWKADLDN